MVKALIGTGGDKGDQWWTLLSQITAQNSEVWPVWFSVSKCLMKWPQEIYFWILKRFLVGVLGMCWGFYGCLGFENWACLSGFWNSGIFPYEIDSILNCHLNLAFECFWMITKWALIPCYEYIQGVQRSRKVSVRFWKFETAKVGMGVKLVKMTIHSFCLFWFIWLWEKFGNYLDDVYFT